MASKIVIDCSAGTVTGVELSASELSALQADTASWSKALPKGVDLAGIVNALINSTSIDQPTKNALIAALKGQ